MLHVHNKSWLVEAWECSLPRSINCIWNMDRCIVVWHAGISVFHKKNVSTNTCGRLVWFLGLPIFQFLITGSVCKNTASNENWTVGRTGNEASRGQSAHYPTSSSGSHLCHMLKYLQPRSRYLIGKTYFHHLTIFF